MSAAALASGVFSSVISCALWECAHLARKAVVQQVKGKTGRHSR